MSLNGPGKYDDVCTLVREKTNALGAVVMIFGGDKGEGFEVQLPWEELQKLPKILRFMADQIEAQQGRP